MLSSRGCTGGHDEFLTCIQLKEVYLLIDFLLLSQKYC